MDLEQARFNMIEQQIRPWEVLDAQVLALLASVRREDFVPAAHQALAFVDMEIPLGTGPGQSMLPPRVQARLVQDLGLQPSDKVLHIGAGTGFVTALLARQGAQVLAFEIDPTLAAQAQQNLARAGIHNAQVRAADGSAGAAEQGPFDVIVLTGSLAEVPQALLDQLAVGGRLGAIVGDEPIMRAHIVTRTGPQQLASTQPWDASAPRLLGFAEPSAFHF